MECTPVKYSSREYSASVQSANEMAERLGIYVIDRYNSQASKYLLEYNREKTKLHDAITQISEKTIDFNITAYRQERRRLLKPPPPPDILVPKKILQAVPDNCVLDFGPDNTIMYYGGLKHRKGVIARNSVIENPHKTRTIRPRPFTAVPSSNRRINSTNKSGRNTSLGFVGRSGRLSSLEVSSPRLVQQNSDQRKYKGSDSLLDRNDFDSGESDTEYNHKSSHKWAMPNRSFRALKQLYTYTKEEKQDHTAERFRVMKDKEHLYFKYLEEKVKNFTV